jgi:hypothetical protein
MNNRLNNNSYSDDERLALLQQKGGIMVFTIVRPERVYRGIIILSPVVDNHRTKNIIIREYKYADSAETQDEK